MSGCSHSDDLQTIVGTKENRPEILKSASPVKIMELDVRPVVANGFKPCGIINDTIEQLTDGRILHIINSFQPGSLYHRMEQRGYNHWTEQEGNDWHIWFYKS